MGNTVAALYLNGAAKVTLDGKEVAVKPTPTEMAMPSSGDVELTIGTPIPGLYYSVLMSDSPSDFGSATSGTAEQATSTAAHTVSASLPTDKNVKYYKVQVKATK